MNKNFILNTNNEIQGVDGRKICGAFVDREVGEYFLEVEDRLRNLKPGDLLSGGLLVAILRSDYDKWSETDLRKRELEQRVFKMEIELANLKAQNANGHKPVKRGWTAERRAAQAERARVRFSKKKGLVVA